LRVHALALFCATFIVMSSACAVTTDRLPTLSAEDYLVQMQIKSNRVEAMLSEWSAAEKRGDAHVAGPEEQNAALTADVEGMIHDVTMAHELGHPVGTYWLAQFTSKTIVESPEDNTQACALYQTALDRGLLAAAVSRFHRCNKAFERFVLNDAGQLKLIAELKHLLQRQDAYQAYYPLPTKRSLCFDDPAIRVPERTLAGLRKALAPAVLSYDQYRAEAYYLLAVADVNAKGEIGPQNLSYLNQAIALGCSDFLGFKAVYEQTLSKGNTSR